MPPKPDDANESGFPKKLAQPAQRALLSAGYTRLEQLNGMGPKALDQLRLALEARGLSFANRKEK